MPDYSTDFSTETTGAHPVGWTERWNGSIATHDVALDSASLSGKTLDLIGSTSNIDRLFSLDLLDNQAHADIIARFRYNGTGVQMTIPFRSSGGDSTQTGYVLTYNGAMSMTVRRFIGGVSTTIAGGTTIGTTSYSFNLPIDTGGWWRLRVSGDRIKAKIWTGVKADEPGGEGSATNWQIDFRDPYLVAGGWWGTGFERNSTYRRVDYFEATALGFDGLQLSALPYTAPEFLAFGMPCRLPDGRTLIVYRKGTSHVSLGDKGTIWGVLSSDGRTWGTPFLIYSHATYDCRDVSIKLTAAGDLLISCFLYDQTNYPTTGVLLNACFVLKAVDPANPDTGGWIFIAANSSFTSWEACAGPPCDLANGYILLSVYGRNTAGLVDVSRVLRSSDGGATYADFGVLADGTSDARHYQEPQLWQLLNGRVLALLRTGTTVYQCHSDDNGATWSEPTAAFSGIGAPRFMQLSGGGLIVCYRSSAVGERSAYRTSTDNGVTWSTEQLLWEDNLTTSFQYGGFDELTPNIAVIAYWGKQGGDESRGYVDYLTVGEAVTPEAFSYTLTGPSPAGGAVGQPSGNFTVAIAHGTTLSSPATISPSDGGNGGTFTPATVVLSGPDASATFTYTPASTGGKTISTSDNRGLTDPAPLNYTVVAGGGGGDVLLGRDIPGGV